MIKYGALSAAHIFFPVTVEQERSVLPIRCVKRHFSANVFNKMVSVVHQGSRDQASRLSTATGINIQLDNKLLYLADILCSVSTALPACIALCCIRSSQYMDKYNSHVSCGVASSMPWYQSQTIGPLSIISAESLWLLR